MATKAVRKGLWGLVRSVLLGVPAAVFVRLDKLMILALSEIECGAVGEPAAHMAYVKKKVVVLRPAGRKRHKVYWSAK